MLIEYGNTVVRDTWELNEESPTGYSRIYYVLEGEVTYEAADGRKALILTLLPTSPIGPGTTCAMLLTRPNCSANWAGNPPSSLRKASRKPCAGTWTTKTGWTT